MRGCLFPDHHGQGNRNRLWLYVVLAVAVVAGWLRLRHDLAHWADIGIYWLSVSAVTLAGLGVLAGAAWVGLRVARGSAPRVPRPGLGWARHVLLAAWCFITWRSVCRRLGLISRDQQIHPRTDYRPRGAHHPLALAVPTRVGVTVRTRTVAGVGREELERHVQHFADHWRVQRVAVAQRRPGSVTLRGLRKDPLLVPLGLADAPAADPGCPYRVWLGRDEHGADRFLDLRNVSGVAVGGQPGGGKSQAITSWLTQLASSPAVQFVNCDGKGCDEFSDFAGRAWITAGDDLGEVLAVLETLTGLLRSRLGCVREFTGGAKNIWDAGVSAEWPLVFSVFDETQTWLDLPAAKALGKEPEKACAQAVKLGSELVRKGRSVGMCTVFATQKPTSDSLPSSVSSNCALSVAFSLKTLDGAKATLGADIGNYPSLNPAGLLLPDYCGVAVVSLRDGLVPFTRIRGPLVTEDEAHAVAEASSGLRRDPRDLLPLAVPDDARELTGEEV